MVNNKSEKKRIAIIVATIESMQLYQSHFKNFPEFHFIQFPSVVSLRENTLKNDRFCGFIIDLRTMMKTPHHEREFLYEVIESFPALRISHSIDLSTVKGSIQGKNLHDEALFSYFLNDLCQHFISRGIRTRRRKKLFLNVTLTPIEMDDIDPLETLACHDHQIKANTIDMTEEGGFILGTVHVRTGDQLNLVISELSDHTPIRCTVQWILPWGESTKHLPGFGASFSSLTSGQKNQLEHMLKRQH